MTHLAYMVTRCHECSIDHPHHNFSNYFLTKAGAFVKMVLSIVDWVVLIDKALSDFLRLQTKEVAFLSEDFF